MNIKYFLIGILLFLYIPVVKCNVASDLILSSKSEIVPILYSDGHSETLQNAVKLWATFFSIRGSETLIQTNDLDKVSFSKKNSIIAFETESACPLAQKIGLDISELQNSRDESHIIYVDTWKKNPLVLIVGKTDIGVELGAWRLLSKVGVWNNSVSISSGIEVNKPFFNVREMHINNRPDYLSWDYKRFSEYPRYLKACGFNSVQLMECLSYWGYGNKKWSREEVASIFRTVAASAHEEGMFVSQFVWGEELLNDSSLISVSARTYGKLVDHLVTHWGDPGPGGYGITQTTTMDMLKAYRQYNPNCRATVSTWYNHSFWNEEQAKNEGAKQMLDETFSPKEIGIALHRWWDDQGTSEGKNPARGELVLKSGRRLGIWGWYLCDYEMTPGEHLKTRVLDKYFSSLPSDVSDKVDWLSVEKCFHGGESRINQYVSGQKMWNPYRPLREIMMDYCRAVYGPLYAEIMCDAYECAEAMQVQYVRGNIPKSDLFPSVEGNIDFSNRVQEVLLELKKIQIPEDWQPNIPDIGDPKKDIKTLIQRLSNPIGEIIIVPSPV
ncbi:hypothetical protein [Mediterranea massiliensis]|uniref:hypothetical protein n=1 Tax=Mediterranea massiliensis TaxID=1841865 RepID=UPI0025A4C218|nr:hypothetical protein [Mediterranea massiliensis]MDM8339112.1 hypothetical protein [Mediterranea massiliensis]